MFCTAINCMDGRVQAPVINYLKQRFNTDYVDLITEPGPNLILAENTSDGLVNSILDRLKVSVVKHHSIGIAVVGHHDCAGNPAAKENQVIQVKKSVEKIRKIYPTVDTIGLWVDENWMVHEL